MSTSRGKAVYLPIELTRVAAGHRKALLSEGATAAAMIRVTVALFYVKNTNLTLGFST